MWYVRLPNSWCFCVALILSLCRCCCHFSHEHSSLPFNLGAKLVLLCVYGAQHIASQSENWNKKLRERKKSTDFMLTICMWTFLMWHNFSEQNRQFIFSIADCLVFFCFLFFPEIVKFDEYTNVNRNVICAQSVFKTK